MVTTLNKTFFMLGKYDTYKGSTQFNVFIFLPFSTSLGNMILIKDRHRT